MYFGDFPRLIFTCYTHFSYSLLLHVCFLYALIPLISYFALLRYSTISVEITGFSHQDMSFSV